MSRRILSAALGSLFLLPVLASADDKKTAVREIELKEFKPKEIPQGNVDKPMTITDEEGLKKVFAAARVRAEVLKQVDFSKEKLLYFRWAGSGGDKLTFEAKGNAVTFRAMPGLTDDLKAHFHLYALPKDATWKMAGK